MTEQKFKNHRRFVPGFHFVLSALILLGVIASVCNISAKWSQGVGMDPLLILLIFICLGLSFWFVRAFPVKVQDRAIRAEQSLRYFILTRTPIDSKLSIGQIAALRFAPDDEFIPLAARAAAEGLSADEIKKAIRNWKGDYHRA